MHWKIEIFCLCLALIPNFICANPSNKVNQTSEDDQNSSLLIKKLDLISQSEHDQPQNWTIKKVCTAEYGQNVCVEVGIPADGARFPRTLRVARDISLHHGSKKVKRQNNDYYGDAEDYNEDSDDYKPGIQDQSKDEGDQKDDDDFAYDYQDDKNTCQVPKDIKTAEIRCKMWPSSVGCKSYCIYGSTFKEGIVRTHKCIYKENRWSAAFEECKPFIDCGVKLRSPGTIKCIRNEVERPPACQISCEMYEDEDEVKNQVSTCKSSGQWEPPLPFCAERKGSHQVPAPHIREHSGLAYP